MNNNISIPFTPSFFIQDDEKASSIEEKNRMREVIESIAKHLEYSRKKPKRKPKLYYFSEFQGEIK